MSADPFTAGVLAAQKDFGREVARIMRASAVRMVNTVIVLHENRGQQLVTLDMLRSLADAIAGLSLPGDKS